MKSSSNGTDIDQMLRTYFRREMPAHWPAAPRGEITTVAQPNSSMAKSRILIGLSLAALVMIYLGLASFFPRDNAAGLNVNGPMIGERATPKMVPAGPAKPAAHP
jgi:hypothetical protein